MSIKFVCTCGKHLRARDEMAARRTVCPRCGAPVGIPSQKPTHSGTAAGPLTPGQRIRARRVVPHTMIVAEDQPALPDVTELVKEPPSRVAEAPPVVPVDTTQVRLVLPPPPQRWRPGRQLETRWYHCLVYPLRGWPLVFGLGLLQTLLTGGIALLLPHLMELRTEQPALFLFALPSFLLPIVILGYVCGFLDCVLTGALAGEYKQLCWPGRQLGLALKSVGLWSACFLAGPVVFAASAAVYWVNCGDLVLVDHLILSELGMVAIGHWLLTLLAVSRKDRLRDVNPLAVAELIHRFRLPLVGLVLLASSLALAHGWLILVALVEIHRDPALGGLGLTAGWVSGLFFATYFLRHLGLWCHRRRF